MSLKCVRLELAQESEDAKGHPNEAYEFTVPLDDDGHLDLRNWDEAAQYCTVCRYQRDGTILHGQLIRNNRGEWAFSYEREEDEEEYVYRFSSHVFEPGECLSITQIDETDQFYRVTSVTRPLVFGT